MRLEISKKKLNDLYWTQGLSTLTIGRQYDVTSTTVINLMKELGIKRRGPGEYLKGHHMSEECKRKISEAQLGEKSNNWKGGRSLDNHGYIRVSIPFDSPFLPMAHKTKNRRRARDITEHRLIMAQHLGRCLQPWELVHHKNGIKTDNRIENLELMAHIIDHSTSMNYQRYIEQLKSEAYEQGKKDLLEALKSKGTIMTSEQMKLLVPDRQYGFGILVFIPADPPGMEITGTYETDKAGIVI